ncbi:alpha/beta hydrolase domain-containing protein [Trujillonella humicola]|uniref:alpha/beta hydrolase domain-containing protein n=1 Tax=Trujillonella humicola TaxID=3383699 RepID=UPI003905B02B
MRAAVAAEVAGPVEGERAPYGAPPDEVLAARGYVSEEFLLGGEAAAYRHPEEVPPSADGVWAAEAVAAAPYRTRLLVVRPRDAAAFSGTVFLEWQNVSAGVEQPAPTGGEVYRGHAWVGVSAQVAGLYGTPRRRSRASRRAPLLDADPERYGVLFHPGEPACFDIFSAAALAVGPARSTAVDPLGGLPVGRVVATGGSQSAMRLCAYADAVHPSHRVVDAFLLSVWEGRAPQLDADADPLYRRTTVREDLGVPLLVVNSEFEVTATAPLALHDTPLRRIWEVTGTPHAIGRPLPPAPAGEWGANPVSWRPVHEAAMRAVHTWLAHGVAPLAQPRVTLAGRPVPRIVRGEDGNAWGGIRVPEIAVPVAEHRGRKGGTGHPPVHGGRRAFPEALLRRLYRSRDDYAQQWLDAVEDLLSAGVVLPEDAPAMRERAAVVAAGLPLP